METKTLEFEGLQIELPAASDDLPLEVAEAYEDNRIIAFVRGLVGAEDWKRYMATRPTMKDFLKLATAIGKVYGFESVGESSGSGDSSEKTAEPSPQASKPSTDSASLQSVNAP